VVGIVVVDAVVVDCAEVVVNCDGISIIFI
jgi:hypothetical protein